MKMSYELPKPTEFDGWFSGLRSQINGGQYQEAINTGGTFLEGEIPVEQKVAVLLQRGLAERMIPKPRMYTEAMADFQAVLKLGQEGGNLEWQLEGLRCLVDAHRTSDRDPKFGPENLAENLQKASAYKQQAEAVMAQIPDWSVAKVNTLIDFGLLALATDGEQGPANALGFYAQAEGGCLALLQQRHLDAPDRYVRLKNVRAAALAESNDPNVLNQALQGELAVHQEFIKIKHQRGSGDSAMVLGMLCEKLGQKEEATRWYQKALEIATPPEGTRDDDVANPAAKALKRLEEQTPV